MFCASEVEHLIPGERQRRLVETLKRYLIGPIPPKRDVLLRRMPTHPVPRLFVEISLCQATVDEVFLTYLWTHPEDDTEISDEV
jgi:hypothetical protein